MYNERISFEFDVDKEIRNIRKHGITFDQAKEVFLDPEMILAPDARHSAREERWFAVGRISDGRIVTVWYTPRGNYTRIIGAGLLKKWRKEYEKRAFARSIKIEVG